MCFFFFKMGMAHPALGPPREIMWGTRGNRGLLGKTWRTVGPLQARGRPRVCHRHPSGEGLKWRLVQGQRGVRAVESSWGTRCPVTRVSGLTLGQQGPSEGRCPPVSQTAGWSRAELTWQGNGKNQRSPGASSFPEPEFPAGPGRRGWGCHL